jgi:glycosyltransferase involved in cell wall biosynthesis
MKRLRVLYLITRSELGGAQTHLMDLVSGFRNHFDQVVVAGQSDSAIAAGEGKRDYLTSELRQIDVPFHAVEHLVQPISPRTDLKAVAEITALIRRVKPDLIHAHTSKAGILGRLAGRLTGVPSVFTAHTWSFAEGTSLKWKALGIPSERIAARWTKRIITVSEANRRTALEKRVGTPEKLVTVHNGISDDKGRANPALSKPVTLAMVARFSQQKDHRTLLAALAGIRTSFKLLLVGDGPTLPEVKAEAASLGLTDRVEFSGARNDVANLLGRSQVLLLITNWEGFPITILEGMRAGLPVIATDIGGTSESVAHEETGLLVPPRDITALQAALTRLLGNADLRVRMGRAGRARYEREFALSAMLRRTLTVYEAALRTETKHNPGLEFQVTRLSDLIRTWGRQEHGVEAIQRELVIEPFAYARGSVNSRAVKH